MWIIGAARVGMNLLFKAIPMNEAEEEACAKCLAGFDIILSIPTFVLYCIIHHDELQAASDDDKGEIDESIISSVCEFLASISFGVAEIAGKAQAEISAPALAVFGILETIVCVLEGVIFATAHGKGEENPPLQASH